MIPQDYATRILLLVLLSWSWLACWLADWLGVSAHILPGWAGRAC